MSKKNLVKGSKEWLEAKAAGRAALDARTMGQVLPERNTTEGHVEGEPGTWNTSGTEVAHPISLERDRYDEQNRNAAPGRISDAGLAQRLVEKGDEVVLEAVRSAREEGMVEAGVVPMPHSNQTRMAEAAGISLEEAKDAAVEQSAAAQPAMPAEETK